MSDEEALLERAAALAAQSVADGGRPFGSIIVQGDTVVGEGVNRVEQTHDPTAHAELEAIRAACAALGTDDLSDCVLVSSAEPCPMCMAACYWARLSKVVYGAPRGEAAAIGFDSAFVYEQLALPPDERRIPTLQRPSAAAVDALQQWRARHPGDR
jgi:guanine deaminase